MQYVWFVSVLSVVFCIAAAVKLLGSVVDNSGREPWNSCPEEHCSLPQSTEQQRAADGLSFYPRVMWSIKPAAALPWMGRHTPAHHNLRLSSCHIHLASLSLPPLHTFDFHPHIMCHIPFKCTLETAQKRKAKQKQSMFLCIFWSRRFKETFENTQQRRAKQMKSMHLLGNPSDNTREKVCFKLSAK